MEVDVFHNEQHKNRSNVDISGMNNYYRIIRIWNSFVIILGLIILHGVVIEGRSFETVDQRPTVKRNIMRLKENDVLRRQIREGEQHIYSISLHDFKLPWSKLLEVNVDQRGIDIVIEVQNLA